MRNIQICLICIKIEKLLSVFLLKTSLKRKSKRKFSKNTGSMSIYRPDFHNMILPLESIFIKSLILIKTMFIS